MKLVDPLIFGLFLLSLAAGIYQHIAALACGQILSISDPARWNRELRRQARSWYPQVKTVDAILRQGAPTDVQDPTWPKWVHRYRVSRKATLLLLPGLFLFFLRNALR